LCLVTVLGAVPFLLDLPSNMASLDEVRHNAMWHTINAWSNFFGYIFDYFFLFLNPRTYYLLFRSGKYKV